MFPTSGFPLEIDRVIADFFPPSTLPRALLVSKVWNDVISQSILWKFSVFTPKLEHFFSAVLDKKFGSSAFLETNNPNHYGYTWAVLPKPIAHLRDYRFSISHSSHVLVEREQKSLLSLRGDSKTCLSHVLACNNALFAARYDGQITRWHHFENPQVSHYPTLVYSGNEKYNLMSPKIQGFWQFKEWFYVALSTGDQKNYVQKIALATTMFLLFPITSTPIDALIHHDTIYFLRPEGVDVEKDGAIVTLFQTQNEIIPSFLRAGIPANQCFAAAEDILCVGGKEKIHVFDLKQNTLIKTIPIMTTSILIYHKTLICWGGESLIFVRNWDQQEIVLTERTNLLSTTSKQFSPATYQMVLDILLQKDDSEEQASGHI